jgi:hypothetical protein
MATATLTPPDTMSSEPSDADDWITTAVSLGRCYRDGDSAALVAIACGLRDVAAAIQEVTAALEKRGSG